MLIILNDIFLPNYTVIEYQFGRGIGGVVGSNLLFSRTNVNCSELLNCLVSSTIKL